MLVFLLERPGELIGRTQLQRELWPEGTHVDFELGLNVAIKKVRGALCDSVEEPKYIETVAGHGYRFVAKVARDPVTVQPSTPVPISVLNSNKVDPPTHVKDGGWWRTRKGLSAFTTVICIALLALTWTRPFRKAQRVDAAGAKKIMLVVLPFDNLSSDSSQEYLSDGMTEELSEQLGNQDPRRLGVIGRTSAMTYKYSHRTIREIGKELGVDYVLEGSVRRSGSEVRVTAQLVQVSDEAHVWAAHYDKNLRNLLQLESDLAKEIARQVGVSIAISQAKKPVPPHLPSPEAHEAYLLGRYNWYKRTSAGWKSGEDYFRLAIQKDPEYAAAYAALAECRIPKEEAQAAALKAITLDPTSGEAYAALAWVQFYWYLDPTAAGPAFRRAIELAPNYAQAHYSYAHYLSVSGHPDEAMNEIKEAILLDPLSPLFNSGLADALSEVGRFDDAVKQVNIALELDPQFAVAYGALGDIYIGQAKYKEAIAEYKTAGKLGVDLDLGAIGYAYARMGDKNKALRILARLQDMEKTSGGVSADLALVQVGLGHNDNAIGWLQKLYDAHDDDALLALQTERRYDPLRADPRFQDIVHRMNFPQ